MRLILAAFALVACGQTLDEALAPVDHPAIRYYQGELHDRVTRLTRDIQNGKTKLEPRTDGTGYLPALLQGLGVNLCGNRRRANEDRQ